MVRGLKLGRHSTTRQRDEQSSTEGRAEFAGVGLGARGRMGCQRLGSGGRVLVLARERTYTSQSGRYSGDLAARMAGGGEGSIAESVLSAPIWLGWRSRRGVRSEPAEQAEEEEAGSPSLRVFRRPLSRTWEGSRAKARVRRYLSLRWGLSYNWLSSAEAETGISSYVANPVPPGCLRRRRLGCALQPAICATAAPTAVLCPVRRLLN